MTGVDTDLATLRSALGRPAIQAYVEALARVEAELSRLREALDNGDRLLSQAGRALEAAEAECARLQQALDPETLARQFHETYERLAPEFGYETRRESAVPWEHVPEANRSLMIAVAAEIAREALAGQPAAAEGPDTPADCEHDYVFEVLPGEFDAALPYRCDKCGQRSPDGVKAADSPVCPCGHSAEQHPAVWSIAGDATTACQVEGCGCDDYDGTPLPADSPEPREGIVMVYDWQHRYLGCMGVERWRQVLDEDNSGSASLTNPERESDGASGKGGRPGVGPSDSQPRESPSDICPECGSGLITLHVAAYPCSRRNTPADSHRLDPPAPVDEQHPYWAAVMDEFGGAVS